jgi:hypothetical protein
MANMSNDKAVGSTNTADKFIAQSGEVTFNPYFYDANAKEWKSNNIYLMVHEIIHCLGFSDKIGAFKKHISTTGTFTGPKTMTLNNGNAPKLSSEKSHFVSGTKDPAGIMPRMMENGGQILSILDLAVLADIGYNINLEDIVGWGSKYPLGFKLNGLYAEMFGNKADGTPYSEYGTRIVVRGGGGTDTLSADSSTAERIILKGYEGADLLITGDRMTIMEGDDMGKLANGTDDPDTYRITTNFKHVISGLGASDRLEIAPDLVFHSLELEFGGIRGKLDGAGLLGNTKFTVEIPDNTIPYQLYGTPRKEYPPFKVTISSDKSILPMSFFQKIYDGRIEQKPYVDVPTLTFYVCYPFDGHGVDPGAKKAMNALKKVLSEKISFSFLAR